jgi:hypothetical protein
MIGLKATAHSVAAVLHAAVLYAVASQLSVIIAAATATPLAAQATPSKIRKSRHPIIRSTDELRTTIQPTVNTIIVPQKPITPNITRRLRLSSSILSPLDSCTNGCQVCVVIKGFHRRLVA